ncbi:hypothetical protein RZS08_32955, partial [Arthrospira platensis SPKY1]|nr:hypothetical protein [Arthrospira platensis SPKY1]
WCRELPGTTGSTFAFERAHWPDGAAPSALAGFEWRLYDEVTPLTEWLLLGSDLLFQPQALQTVKRESGSWSLVVRGRVRPSLRANGSAVPDLGEVTVTLEQNRNDGALANVVVDEDLIWPLDGLDAGPEAKAAVAARKPWLELTLDDSARFDKAILNVPILGKWRRLSLDRLNEGDEGLRFSTPNGTGSGKLT